MGPTTSPSRKLSVIVVLINRNAPLALLLRVHMVFPNSSWDGNRCRALSLKIKLELGTNTKEIILYIYLNNRRGEVMDPDDVWEVLDEGDVNDFHE